MRKFCAFIFVVSYIAMTAFVNAATSNFDFDGVKLQCERKSKIVLKCNDGKQDLFVIVTNSKYVVYDQFDPPRAKYPSKVLENGKLLHYQNDGNNPVESQEFQRLLAEALLIGTRDLKDSFSQQVSEQASSFLKRSPEYIDNVNVVLNEKETLSCTRGETRVLSPELIAEKGLSDLKLGCTYYSCSGNDPREKILFYMPPIGSIFVGPSVLAMKDGQARYYDDDFTIVDNSKSVVSVVKKSIYAQHDYNPSESPLDFPVNPELLIPTKYNASRTSYDYLQHFAVNDQDAFGLKGICKGDEVNKLFNEQKKIAADMKDYLAYADIISYLSAVNGNIRSVYVDKVKAQEVGCSFQDKILDYNALPELQRLEGLSGVRAQENYPSEKDVQNLFKKAQKMSDIPFGYKYDGCYARAHVMARRFEKMGMKVKKAWIKGDLRVPGTDINWGYHVAPLIEAKDSKGNIVQYVLDPSVNDKAVTLDEWAASMDKAVSGPVMKTTYPIAENGLEFQRTVLAVSSSEPYGPVDMKFLTEEQKMENAREVLAEYTQVLEGLKKKGKK